MLLKTISNNFNNNKIRTKFKIIMNTQQEMKKKVKH